MKIKSIIHVDIDAFYASVEELDNPSLKGKPVVVGGLSKRSIITTANYEARKYGLHSAMPMFMAKNLCENLIVMPMRRSRYLEKSKEVFEILKKYSKIIEKVSIDESYLDVTDKNFNREKILELKEDVFKNTGLKVSVGLSYNKFLAKLASEWNKPDGIKIITKEDMPEILLPLDVSKIHGIGKKSEKKLKNIGIFTVRDMYELSEEFLIELFGKMGEELYLRIRGIDNRSVKVHRERKSIGTETTFKDTNDIEVLKDYLKDFSKEVSKSLIKNSTAAFTLTLKMKSKDFVTTTRSKTFEASIYKKEDIYRNVIELFDEYYDNKKLRLIGITASNLVDLNTYQLSFFDGSN